LLWTVGQVLTSSSGPLRKLMHWGGPKCQRQMWSSRQVLLWKLNVLQVVR
jgi:hypothetical protein